MNEEKFGRRQILKLSGLATASAVLSACQPVISAGTDSAQQNNISASEYPQVTIGNTEVRSLTSSIVNQEYQLSVAFPHDYATSDKTYPLVVVLDANGFFGMVTETVRAMQIAKELPDILIVGIGYPNLADIREVMDIRIRDLTPTADEAWVGGFLEQMSAFIDVPYTNHGSGGADKFLAFIREELMPFLETTYRVDSADKTLLGDSLSGLFALYTLFHQPDSFDRYIIGSPSVFWDNKIVNIYEAEYAAAQTSLPAKVFMSTGSLEGDEPIADILALAETMQSRDYKGLDLTTHVFEDETHVSVAPATFSRGLRIVFSKETSVHSL